MTKKQHLEKEREAGHRLCALCATTLKRTMPLHRSLDGKLCCSYDCAVSAYTGEED